MRIASAASAIALAMCVASPADAKVGDGACIWGRLPAASRDRILAAYAEKGADFQVSEDQVSETALGVAVLACGISSRDAEMAGMMLAFQIVEIGSKAALEKKYGISAEATDAALAQMSDEQKDLLLELGRAFLKDKKPKDEAYEPVAVFVGLVTPNADNSAFEGPRYALIVEFMTAHALRRAGELAY